MKYTKKEKINNALYVIKCKECNNHLASASKRKYLPDWSTCDCLEQKFNTKTSYKIDSGLGGIFTLKFIKIENSKYLFKVINPDFEQILEFSYSEVTNKISES